MTNRPACLESMHIRDRMVYLRKYNLDTAEDSKEWWADWHNTTRRKTAYQSASSTQNNRAGKLGLIGRVSYIEWLEIIVKHDNRCVICQEEGDLSMDHIIPLSKGGQHCIENIQPLCSSCNKRKYNKIIER